MSQEQLKFNRESDPISVGEDAHEEKELNVEPKKEEEKVELEQVDLGYTDPNKKETEAKVVDEKKAEDKPANLNEISTSVQRRIDQLTKRYREAERREKAALDYARGIQDKYKKAETTLNTVDDNYLKEFDARIDAQREQVKSNLKAAIENNDADKITEANDLLAKLSVEKEKRPTQTVASAGRKQEGRRTVKLTRSQVAIAKKLGVPLEEYAKFVK